MTEAALLAPRPAARAGVIVFANATLVTPEGPVRGSVRVEDGRIAEVRLDHAGDGLDLGGDFLLPGVVDVHTDHLEKHVFPRAHVQWDFATAVMAHDAQMIGGGTTTVFDAICVGASLRRPERRDILAPCLDALETLAAQDMLRADHRVHLRCEVSDPATPALVAANIDRPLVGLASVMDHAPGDRQSPDVERYVRRMVGELGVDLAEAREMTAELRARSARIAASVRAEVTALVRARGLRLMSHDDASEAHVAQARAEGGTVAEFPTTLAAARAARAAGMAIVAGAPNFLRGGSQSGNVAVRDLLAEGLVDMLSSDYVPRSPLDAAFAIADDPDMPHDLHAALALVSANPARAAGLRDRGAVAVGLRADLIRVRRVGGRAHLREAWIAGRRVA
jgi:alpha-D-ribose 1-methylphosphonate 5-triphosphate diphosphatase